MFMGTSRADNMTGTAGADVLNGQGGNDSIEGSTGIDMAIFSGTRASYTVTVTGTDTVSVADTVAGRDGTDTLHAVERAQFDDLWVGFDIQGHAGQAYRLYQAAFDRAPDLSGLGFQINALDKFDDLWVGFDIQGHAGQAYRLYQAAFDRAPDQPGLGFQINALDTGFALVQVADNFLASPEFQHTYGALDDAQYVTRLYENVLKREPEDAGLQFHLQELAAGESRAALLTHFSESPECQQLLMGAMHDGVAYIL
jgi:serralysin